MCISPLEWEICSFSKLMEDSLVQSLSNHLHFITATLLLSVASPLFAFTYDFKPLIAQAQTALKQSGYLRRLTANFGKVNSRRL